MAEPTAQEQLLIELINRARLDPSGEAARYGIGLNDNLAPGTISAAVKAPLATNLLLNDAADGQSQWMVDNDVFSHTGAGGSNAGQRMQAAGYVFSGSWTWGENIALTGTTGVLDLTAAIYSQHEGLFLSAGHRTNILGENFVEVGVGQAAGPYASGGVTYNASLVTENFARTGGAASFLTGVVYTDADGNDFYSVGEGLGGVSVAVTGGAGTTSYGSGGYDIANVSGSPTVSFSGGGLAAPVSVTVAMPGGNVQLSLEDGATVASSASTTLGSGAVSLVLRGDAASGSGNAADNTLTGNGYANALSGLGGRDVLIGGGGADTLSGGAGMDRFVDTAANLVGDHLTDFSTRDLIEVSGTRFGGVQYNAGSGVLELDSSGDGSFASDVQLSSGLAGEWRAWSGGETVSTLVWLVGDTDGDGIVDDRDNSILVPNADQRDSDGDGYGNITDADLNGDRRTDFFDLSLFDGRFGGANADADFNGDGRVDFFDLSILDGLFGKSLGPSMADFTGPGPIDADWMLG